MKPGPVLALLLLALPSQPLLAKEISTWWNTEQYKPTEDKVQSIPVKQLDKTWLKASILTKEKLSPEAVSYLSDKQNYRFQVDADFNKDGRRDRAMVGVYEDASGAKGRFLLILTEKGRGSWKRAFLQKIVGEPGFSALVHSDGNLGWEDCFECDASLGYVVWDQNKYSLAVSSVDY